VLPNFKTLASMSVFSLFFVQKEVKEKDAEQEMKSKEKKT